MRLVIGDRSFASKGEARAAIRTILHAHAEGDDLVGEDAVLIGYLFEMHPESAIKAAKGVSGFGLRFNNRDGVGSTGFHVLHPDGTSTAWSYQVALTNSLSVPSVRAAMRGAILLSQTKFRSERLVGREFMDCPRCGKITPRKDVHADHLPPTFTDLAERFIAQHGTPEVVSAQGWGDEFADLKLKAAWVRFHDAHAIRQLVCGPCNLRARHPAKEPAC